MPNLGVPSTQDEHNLWVRAVAAPAGTAVEGIERQKKQKLQKRFYVLNGKLMCRESSKPAMVLSEFDALWKKHHIDVNHPGKIKFLSYFRLSDLGWGALCYTPDGIIGHGTMLS